MNSSTAVTALAALLYASYCTAVGGVAFNGDPLPSWEDFRADPEKAKQADAWEAAAQTALDECGAVETQRPPRFMRAKLKVASNNMAEVSDTVKFVGVPKSGQYPADGSDEDNTFAKFSPSVDLGITITNPALLGLIRPGQKYYVDFFPVTE